MNINTLHNNLVKKETSDFYIFYGEEWYVQKTYIKQIAKVRRGMIKYIDSIANVYDKLKNTGFIQTNFVYVARDDKEFMTNEKLQEQVKNGLLGDNTYILLLTNLDKRTKFYNKYKEDIVEFNYLNRDTLIGYVQKEISVSDRNAGILVDICENDLNRIYLEIDKIKRYIWEIKDTQEGKSRFDLAFEQLVKDGTIYEPPYDAIFDFVDAVLKRKVNLAFDLLEQCYGVGEATLVMITNLYNNAKQLLQVQSCTSNDISNTTGLTNWQIKNAKERVGYYKIYELVDMIKLLCNVEQGIKTGLIEEENAMEYILCKVLN